MTIHEFSTWYGIVATILKNTHIQYGVKMNYFIGFDPKLVQYLNF